MTEETVVVQTIDYTNFLISILSVIIAPVIAVWVAQCLQNRANKRRDKMEIFRTLMMYRIINHIDAVKAYNMIDIVFSDSKKVREQWAKYHKILSEKPFQVETAKKENYKLLEIMANDLGYKNTISWESIQYPYYPEWLGKAIDKNEKYTDAQELISELVKNFNPNLIGSVIEQFLNKFQVQKQNQAEEEN